MDNVLVVSSSEKNTEFMVQFLKSARFTRITIAKSGSEAKRLLAQGAPELVLINAPLSDEVGYELASLAAHTTAASTILLVKNDYSDAVAAKVEEDGVMVVPKPINRVLLYQTIKLAAAARQRLLGLRNENVKLQKKIEEIRLVDRAKCVLIQYLGMTEPQAHRYIEKQAMDMRRSRKEIAEGILATYET